MNKKIIISIVLTSIFITSFSYGAEISLEPSNGKYSPGCMIGINIIMDPEGKAISSTDIILESSMQFIKFEEGNLFPYFFPAKTIDNIVHIIGFTSGPSQWIKEKGTIGKIYFKPKEKSDTNGAIKFYIKKKGDTSDTNLSIGGGVDVLEDTRNGFYTFDGTGCEFQEEESIEIFDVEKDKNPIKSLEETINKIDKEHRSDVLKKSREKNNGYVISLFVLILILVMYFKVSKGIGKGKTK